MAPLDLNSTINVILTALGSLLVLIATYYVHRFLERMKKRDAREALDEALRDGVALAVASQADPQKMVADAVAFVEANTAPDELKVLAVDRPLLEQKVKARLASRAIVF